MKRSLFIVVPLALLILINACNLSSGALPKYSSDQWTAIAVTQQVMGQPGGDRIKHWLNAVPVDFDKIDALEESLVGKYDVIGVGFPHDKTFFEVGMNCECTSGSACCVPEHMFVLTVQKISKSQDNILAEVPPEAKYLDVVCYDHKFAFATVYAPWEAVKGFLLGQLSASDLSSQIIVRKMN